MQGIPLIGSLLSALAVVAGLWMGFHPKMTPPRRGFLTAVSTGVLIYLFVEICAKSIGDLQDLLRSAMADYPTWLDFWTYSLIFLGGLTAGLLSLVYFRRRFIQKNNQNMLALNQAKSLALMLSAGAGLHNAGRGLSIGAEYSWGENSIALLLALGFGFHNMAEGSNLAGPMLGHTPGRGYLFLLGLIGGLPLFLGAVVGSLWTYKPLEIFFLATAAGITLYLIGESLHRDRSPKGEAALEVGLLVGFISAFVIKMILCFQNGSYLNSLKSYY